MKSVLIEKEDCARELDIEVPAEDWQSETEKLAKDFAKLAHVPGFRPGHVPVTVVKQRFRNEIRSELLKDFLPKTIEAAAKENNLKILTQPEVKDLVLEENKPLTFKAQFEILPTVEIAGYKGLKAEEEPVKVSDEEVENTLKGLREQSAEFLVAENRPSQTGDFVTVTFTAYPSKKSEGKPEKSFQGKDVVVELGGERTVKEFTENLLQKSVGDEAQFAVDYADDFADKRLAGRSVAYHVKVEAIKVKSLPDINDELAKTLGEFDTLADLKNKIKSDLEANKKQRAREKTTEKLVDQVLEANPFPVPRALVEAQIETRLQGMLRSLHQQGVNPQQLSVDWERLREEHRTAATREVKGMLALESIAQQEHLEVSDQDIDVEIGKIAERTKQAFSAVKQHLTKEEALDKLRSQLTHQKTLNFLYENAEIINGPAELDR
ncbi:MAG: trigger factor [Acidobacteriia bacterium]|nr:trigger factor [Terriglobia bacterium]